MDVELLLKQIPRQAWWLFVFFSAFLENIFPPYPGDSVVVLGGYLWGAGKMGFLSLATAVYGGNVAGALVMYYFGEHVLGFFRKFPNKWTQEILNTEKLKKTESWFAKWGILAVLLSRFSAGIRFFIAIVAGMFRMNIAVFFVSISVATLLWNSLLIYGGYVLGENWRKVTGYLQLYNIVLISLVAAGGVAWFLYRRYRNQHAKQ